MDTNEEIMNDYTKELQPEFSPILMEELETYFG